jgi:hypothetical protein
MHGRIFTWSNERIRSMMKKIDHALVSIDWDLAFPNTLMQAITSSVSVTDPYTCLLGHGPLHLSMSAGHRPKKALQVRTLLAES